MSTSNNTLAEKLGPGNFKPLARAAGLSPSHVSRVLRGHTAPSYTTLVSLASAARVSVGQVVGYIEQRKAERVERLEARQRTREQNQDTQNP